MISFNTALTAILNSVRPSTGTESVPLILSLGRTLSSAITANEDYPAEANSAMDGFAVRAADTAGASKDAPVRLHIIGDAPAGKPCPLPLNPGEAVAIMTGGILPTGADAVVQVEVTRREGDDVLILRETPAGTAVRPAGEDIRSGEEILRAGRRITPADIGVLATTGHAGVPVRIKPKVAVLSTGNELVEPAHQPPRGHLRNSSGPALIAAVHAAGAEAIDLGIVGDAREELEEAIETGLQYDLLLTTGGVSAGEYDFVQHLLPEAGVTVAFHGVAIRPGKPLMFGTRDDGDLRTWVFGLPGNPVSSLVTFEIFVRPLLRGLLGQDPHTPTFRARLRGSITKRDDKRHFQRALLTVAEDGHWQAEPLYNQSSGAMSSLSRGNGLIVVPEDAREVGDGEMVEVVIGN